MMSDPGFLRSLQDMNCDEITLKQQQAVRSHLRRSDKLDQMEAISKAGYGLYKFVLAVLDYCAVYREVFIKFCELTVFFLFLFSLIFSSIFYH